MSITPFGESYFNEKATFFKGVNISGELKHTGNSTFFGKITAGSIARIGGTSSQFLKADGSIDSNTYLTGVNPEFASGTLMLFQQTAAPVGWTKQTTHNNKALRVVSGSAGSGGSIGFTSAFTSRTPAGSVSGTNTGGAVSNHTLTTAQMPSHDHDLTVGSQQDRKDGSSNINRSLHTQTTNSGAIQNRGGGGAHNHGFTQPTWSGTFSGTELDFTVQYVDLIIASRD